MSKQPLSRIVVRIATLVLAGIGSSPAWASCPQDPSPPYQLIKGIEDVFGIPTPGATVDVGTFDAATGTFRGLVTVRIEPDPIEIEQPRGGFEDRPRPRPRPRPTGGPRKPRVITPEARVDAVNTQLRFRVVNRRGDFSVTANGIRTNGARDSVTINVGRAATVRWSVSSGGKTFTDTLKIRRPRIIGAGAFTVPALPVAVVYEPISDQEGQNRASYASARTIGSSITTTKRTSNRTTRPVFEGLGELKKFLEAPLKALGVSSATKKEQQALAAFGSAIDVALGTQSSSTTEGSVTTRNSTLSLRSFVEDGFHTGTNEGGPGIGDVLVFMRDAELVWLADDGVVRLALLGHRRLETRAVRFLAEHLDDEPSGLTRPVIESLLKLDPFVAGGPDVPLSEPRFVKIEEFGVNGVDVTKSFALEQTTATSTVREDFRTTVDDFGKGLLSFTGIGIGETRKVEVTYTDARTVSESETQTSKAAVHFHAEPDELYVVAVYYDRLFGTFAFQSVPLLEEPALTGLALGPEGEILARELVTVTADGSQYTTHANDEGEYAFYSSNLRPGPVQLEYRGLVREALAVEPVR